MAKDEWFRRTDWTEQDQKEFFQKLSRARSGNRSQYLRIQAVHLLEVGNPSAARELLHRVLADDPADLYAAWIHEHLADCAIQLSDFPLAIEHYRQSLKCEEARPNVRSNSSLQFPLMALSQEFVDLYPEIELVLDQIDPIEDLMLPKDRYHWSAAKAILHSHRGEMETAREFARTAMKFANRKTSGLRYHKDLGLVTDRSGSIEDRLQRILATEPSG